MLWLCRFYQKGSNGLLEIFWASSFLTFCRENYSENHAISSHCIGSYWTFSVQKQFKWFSTCRTGFLKPCVTRASHLGSGSGGFRRVPHGQPFLMVSVSVGSRWSEGSEAVPGNDGTAPLDDSIVASQRRFGGCSLHQIVDTSRTNKNFHLK